MAAACAAIAGMSLTAAAPGRAADTELARTIEAAKGEGEVHFIDAIMRPKTQARLATAFRKKYGLPEGFRVTHTLRGTGEVVASVQQEIRAGQHTIDVAWVGAPAFFKAAARQGDLLPYRPPEWGLHERNVRRLGVEADPPNWITPTAYHFTPVWNRKCPGFADVRIASWWDLVNPAFRGKLVLMDPRKSFTHTANWMALQGALGVDYWPKLVDASQPVIIFGTQQSLQKVVSCEYPIQTHQIPGRVYQHLQEDPSLDLGVASPREGIVLLGIHMAILKGSKHPNAAKLFVDFILSEEGAHEFVAGEAQFTFREGFRVQDAVRPFAPEVDTVKAIPVNWAALEKLSEVRRIQDEFRRVLRVD